MEVALGYSQAALVLLDEPTLTILNHHAVLLLDHVAPAEALPYLDRALALAEAQNDRAAQAYLLDNLGAVHYQLGNRPRA